MKYLIPILIILCFSCNSKEEENPSKEQISVVEKKIDKVFYKTSRATSSERLQHKISEQEPIVVHIKVPLCDNDNQGIVPVPKSLGNGLDASYNLYWGAMYGVKGYFKHSKDWELIETIKYPNDYILERLVFKKKSLSKTIYIVADAYKGERMKACLNDYFAALAGNLNDHLQIGDISLGINSNADLSIFNGHNGLMDVQVDFAESNDEIVRDAAVIGCVSYNYFEKYLIKAQAYPILTTNNLMAPEAYNLEAVINAWLVQKEEDQIVEEVAKAYHKYQKCGMRGARNLFISGWR